MLTQKECLNELEKQIYPIMKAYYYNQQRSAKNDR